MLRTPYRAVNSRRNVEREKYVPARVATSALTKTDAHGIFGRERTSLSENPLPLCVAVAAYT